jgi:hypothetical protein
LNSVTNNEPYVAPEVEEEPAGPLYLYNEGAGEDDWVVGYTSNCGSTTKEDNYLYLSVNSGISTECTFVTDNTIDLSDYTTLHIDWDNDAEDREEKTIDISSFNGSYYIRVHHTGYMVMEFHRRKSYFGISTLKNVAHAALEVDGYIESAGMPPNDSLRVYKVWLE